MSYMTYLYCIFLLYMYISVPGITTVLAYDGNYYFLNQKQFSWNQARSYCQSHCNSELASIHDETQNLMAIDAVTNSDEWQITDNYNTWLGLYGTPKQWNDGTLYDYGTMTTQYPWQYGGSYTSENCTKLFQHQGYAWQSDECDAQYISLCNSCDSKFNKYVVVKEHMQWVDHENSCVNYFGTEWASIHSQQDFDEAVSIAQLFSENIWIGLNDRTGNWSWVDGTSVDFADNVSPTGQYPWNSDEPNNLAENPLFGITEDCVLILWEDGRLNDDNCYQIFVGPWHWALCNAPSELCYRSGKYWKEMVLDTANIAWNGESVDLKCELDINATMGKALIVMIEKQLVNNDDTLRIHYMMKLMKVENGSNGDSGIVIDYVNETNYYYAGIGVSDGVNRRLFIGRMDNGHYNELNQTVSIISANTYYQMEVEVSYNNTFTVSVNGYAVSYTDIMKDNNIFSGYIGIINTGLRTRAKSLFVSGSKVYLNNSTVAPTVVPTIAPTSEDIYTVYPTTHPTYGTIIVSPLSSNTLESSTTGVDQIQPLSTATVIQIGRSDKKDALGPLAIVLGIGSVCALFGILIVLGLIYFNISNKEKEKEEVNSNEEGAVDDVDDDDDVINEIKTEMQGQTRGNNVFL